MCIYCTHTCAHGHWQLKSLGRSGVFFMRRCFSGSEFRSEKLTDFLLSELCDEAVSDVTLG